MQDSAMTTHASCRCGRIRELNDQLRQRQLGGRVVMTRGIMALGKDALLGILKALAEFGDFNAENDPHGEHDMGILELGGLSILWKIDYYDLDFQYASADPADLQVTARVLTIMLAEEY